jgi:hypothetical protein
MKKAIQVKDRAIFLAFCRIPLYMAQEIGYNICRNETIEETRGQIREY